MSNQVNVPIESVIEARVFRIKPKPRFIPYKLWRKLAKSRLRLFGRWEDKGIISTAGLGK